MKQCIIIEDQIPAQRILKHYLEDYPNLSLMASFTNALDARDWLQKNQVDLIFLDIHLPRLSGMDFLRNLQNQPVVILTTAFPDYALESYEYRVIDYLLKPIAPERFKQAIQKFFDLHQVSNSFEFMVKSGYEYQRVNSAELSFIKSDMDYTELHVADRVILSKESLNHWEDKLENQGFIRAHRSYLVNISHISDLQSSQIRLNNAQIIPLGRAYKEKLRAALL